MIVHTLNMCTFYIVHIYRMLFFLFYGCWNLINVHNIESAHVQCMYNHYTKFKYYGMKIVGVTYYTNQTPSNILWKII